MALQLGLPELLRLGEGERAAAALNAHRSWPTPSRRCIGATFQDGGFDAARNLVQGLFGEIIETTGSRRAGARTRKTELQEWLQARRLPVPSYRISATRGQAHAQTFEVECSVPALNLAESGEGRSRRAAEQEAARRMLDSLKASDEPGSPLQS
jgi:ribonuclease-3